MEDLGYSDMADNMREGDVAAKGPAPIQTAEAEAMVRQVGDAAPAMTEQQKTMAKAYWQNPGAQAKQVQALTTIARAQAGATAAAGQDPVGLLHEGAKKSGGMRLDVVSRSKGV
jgi:hypothetical protein